MFLRMTDRAARRTAYCALVVAASFLGVAGASGQTCPNQVWSAPGLFAQIIETQLSHDGTMVAVCGTNEPTSAVISIRSAVDGAELRRIDVPGLARWIAWRPGTSHIACGYQVIAGQPTTAAKMWDAATGVEIRTFTGFLSGWTTKGTFSADGTKLGTLERSFFVHVFNADTGEQELLISGIVLQSVPVSLAFSPDGTQLAIGSAFGFEPNTVRIWSVADGSLLHNLYLDEAEAREVNAVHYSPDGAYLAATNGMGQLMVWETTNFTVVRSLVASQITGSLRGQAIAFAPDNDLIAWSVGPYPLATLFVRVSTGEVVATCEEASASGLSFTPDGTEWLRGSDYWGHGVCLYKAP